MALTALLTWGDIPLSPALKEESPGEGYLSPPRTLVLVALKLRPGYPKIQEITEVTLVVQLGACDYLTF